MNLPKPPPQDVVDEEVSALIETLHETGQRLEDLTAGEVDAVADRGGRPFLLRRSQDTLRVREAGRQAAILDALPAHIALLDNRGLIVSVNDAWRRFDGGDAIQRPGYAIGSNYLEICERADGDDPSGARQVADGMRSVLSGEAKRFSIEYSCDSGTGQRWFLLTVAPFARDPPNGAVVMHLDISTRKCDEAELLRFGTDMKATAERVRRLNRVYAVLSGINALIVRVRDREELYREACRIAVDEGNFAMAWIGTFDPATEDVTPVAWAGENSDEITRVKSSSREDTPRGLGAVGRAIRERRPVFNNDIVARGFGGPRLDAILELGYRSQITLPVFEDDAIAATLTMYVREADFFDEEEVRLLAGLAGDISFGLGNIGRQHKLDKLGRVRAVSSGINAAIIRIHDREALLRETCRIAVEHGKFDLVWIAFIDQEKERIEPVAWRGFSTETAHELTWAKLGAPGITIAEIMRTRKVAVRDDIDARKTPGILRREAVEKGARASVAVPFMVDDRVVAAMLLYAAERGFFDAEEVGLLSEVAADVSFALQAIEKQEKLEYLSYYDVLTGLPNRALFVDRLSQQMRSRGGEQQMVALILLDLERFRNINESVGHRGGDEVLISIAQRLGDAFHGKDYLARISSNGFGVIVRGIKDAAAVVHLVENGIFSRFTQPFLVADREIRVAVKAGIAMFPVDGDDADILFRNAESALKRVQASSNRYLFYAADMNAQAADAIALEMRLRKAIDAGQFVLHYQPKIELATGRICGLEALIRWNDPQTGLVPPDRFIPNLEETGMILEVGTWALQQAMADHAEWAAQALDPPRVAVNVSQIQLRQAGFVATVADVIRDHAGGAAGLALEITESLFMENFDDCVAKLTVIRDMGVEIAVDDFGTGYSSLSYISRLPVDSLKIDRSFILKMATEADSMSIVSMVITLAHALDLKVVAEGVETQEQSNTLRLLRCDEAQGYLFARPVAAQDIAALLREQAGKPNRTRRELRPRALM